MRFHSVLILTAAVSLAILPAQKDENVRRMQEDRAFAKLGAMDPALVVRGIRL
jgi:hypothetical protein